MLNLGCRRSEIQIKIYIRPKVLNVNCFQNNKEGGTFGSALYEGGVIFVNKTDRIRPKWNTMTKHYK